MRIALAVVCWIALSLPLSTNAADNAWLEIRTPHFRILSDGEEREARAVAGRFEQIRLAFASALPSLRLEPPVPLLVLALKDESSLKALLPEMWRQKSLKPGGFFTSGSEKAFAVIRLDLESGPNVVYHEYTHSVLNANFRWLPLWLNEGLAEFFGNTQFAAGKIYLGAPNIRAEYTRGQPLLPIEKLIGITVDSAEYRAPDKVQIFYSESWGLVHSLLVSTPAERGRRLQQFLNLLEKGADQGEAFKDAIGDFKTVEEALKQYLDRTSPDVITIDSATAITPDGVSARRLSPAERDAELGAAQVWLHENKAALPRLERALKEEPARGLAIEAMAFLKFVEGRDAEAQALFERASRADGKLYLSTYYAAMLSAAPARAALNHVIELNPAFAPAYVQLAIGHVREGNLQTALDLALKAQQLWPSKGSYHILLGNILHGQRRDREAAAVARYVAQRWKEPDRQAAIELWQRLPAEARTGQDLPASPAPARTKVTSGIVSSVTCGAKDRTMRIVLDGVPLTFRVDENKIGIGLSDTVWYSAEHFDRCRHLAELKAIVQYLPSSASGLTGEMVRLDVYP